MRIAIPTTGSRGDVQPYVALGAALQQRGHLVTLATHADFEGFVKNHGLDFVELLEGGRELHASEVGDRMIHAGANPFTFLHEFCRLRRPMMRALLQRCWHACRDADLILATNTELLLAEAVAEKERLPVVWTCLQPVAPTRFRASCLFPSWPAGAPGASFYNLATHALTGWGMWLWQREALNDARRAVLDLPPVPIYGPIASFLSPRFCLDGYSAHVAPRPKDWHHQRHVTGYWFVEPQETDELPDGMDEFLDAGEPPVCIGFGSMHNRDSAQVTQIVLEALERAGRRGILLTGWGGMSSAASGKQVFVASGAPHWLLFPRTAGVVHHGGAGTTAASLAAGVPMLAVPYMADQTFWGRRAQAMGVGPEPIPRRRLTAPALAKAVDRLCTDEAMRRRAARLGQSIRAEQGAEQAARLIDERFPSFAATVQRGRRRSKRRAFTTGGA